MRKFTSFFVVVLLLPLFLFAEKRPKNKMKFGKIPIEEFQIKSTPLDTTADAIIIGDFHKYEVIFATKVEVYRRIKILTPEGIDQLSDLVLNIYDGPRSVGSLYTFKASTYNLVDGEIIESKLDKENCHIEEDEYWRSYKYSLPDVKVGSIIEYRYIIIPGYFGVPTYYPQQDYPVLWSELDLVYVDGINFKHFVSGNTNPIFKDRSSGANNTLMDTWIFSNIPPLKQEEFMGPVNNYRTQVDYELLSIEVPGRLYENFTTSWKEISKDYMESDHRGKLAEKKRFFKDIVETVSLDTVSKSNMQKVEQAISYIRSNFKWNERDRFSPTYDFNKVLKEKSGNSADLNFLLMGVLNSMAIPTKPVLLSTRDHGLLLKHKPSLEDINYCIASFEIDHKRHYIDVASFFSGIDELPAKCINGEALLLDIYNPKWIKINADKSYRKTLFVQANITEDLNIEGTIQIRDEAYAAQAEREEILNQGSVEEYIENKIKSYEDLMISNYEVSNEKINEKPLSSNFHFQLETDFEDGDDMFHFSPILFRDFDENPFQKDHREFAIDFQYPYSLGYTYLYQLPEDYEVDELPKPAHVSNPDQTLSLFYNVSSNTNSISIVLRFDIKKAFFLQQDYEDIKTFFDYFISQQNNPIILKLAD